jgi:hypothetical protein
MVEYAAELEFFSGSKKALDVFVSLSKEANSEVNKEPTRRERLAPGFPLKSRSAVWLHYEPCGQLGHIT